MFGKSIYLSNISNEITLEYEVEWYFTSLHISEEFDDSYDDDYDEIRPDTITVNLIADGEVVATTTSSADDNWNYSFDGVRVYSKGKKVTYTVEEVEVPFYTATYEGYNITNTHVPEKGDTDIIDPPHTDVNAVTVDYTNVMYFDDKKRYIGK